MPALSACGGGGGGAAAPAVAPPTAAPSATPTAAPSASPAASFVPQAGSIYLGAYADPPPGTTDTAPLIAGLETAVGRKFVLSLHYDGMDKTFPSANEVADRQVGRIPIVSLNCNDTDYNIANGSQDALLVAKAEAIKAFGGPVLVRFQWEFNFPDTILGRTPCADPTRDTGGITSAPEFIAAYRHVHDIMVAQGAANIVWVWNPSGGSGVSGVPYWPGDAYVDWVGIDVYDRTDLGATIFGAPYGLYATMGNGSHPVIISETGAVAGDQTNFLGALPAALQSQFPRIKALVYFDSFGSIDYSLTPAGLAAFRTFAGNPYMSAVTQ